ncbi:MAG: (2Fe-2S) ferredoxin domain-containing protein [Acidimicrobiia bacterium]|nr:(2Fe-2S) ferredoxin domain-containing protein [Acidimicrobiia bacterium]
MTLQLPTPCVLLCTGKDCRRRKDFKKLRNSLEEAGIRLETVSCLGTCEGPVAAVVGPDAKIQIAVRLRGKSKRERVVAGATQSPKKLKAVTAKGKKAKKARKRALRRLEELDGQKINA